MIDGLPYSRLVSFDDGAPDGAINWVLRDVAGTQIATGTFTPPVGAVSASINVPAANNTRAGGAPLRITRVLTWSYLTGGATRAGRERYFVEGSIPFPVSEDGVRNLLGAPSHNLTGDEIDLIGAYWRIEDEAGAANLLTFASTDGPSATVIARGIEASAALEVLLTMPARLAQKESSGTDTFQRGLVDWALLQTRLEQLVRTAVSLVNAQLEFDTGSIFVLTNPVDRFTGQA